MTTVYVIRRADPAKQPFVIQPYTTNGPLTPNNPTPLYPYAVSANSTLVLMGKGEFDYGEPLQQDLFYMLENFANSTAPSLAVEGQMWYDNVGGILNVCTDETLQTFKQLFYADGSIPFTNNLDMGGFRIINMADPVAPQDAVTKFYSDTNLAAHAGDFTLHMTTDQNTWFDAVVPGPIPLATPTEVSYLSGVTSAIQTQIDSKLNLDGSNSPMTGFLTLFASPIAVNHAATKGYVDISIAGAIGGLGGVYVAKAGDTMLGFLTLNADPIVALHAATKQYVDAQVLAVSPAASAVDYTVNPSLFTPSFIRDQLNVEAGSIISAQAAIDNLDTGLDPVARRQDERYMNIGDGVTQTFVFPFNYSIESNKLFVHFNGVKQYHDMRAVGTVSFDTAPTLFDDTGLIVGAYTFNLQIDGGTVYLITVTVGAIPFTFGQLFAAIQSEMFIATPQVPGTVIFDRGIFYFYSDRQGTTNAIATDVTLTDITLWAAITPYITTLTSFTEPYAGAIDQSYKEGFINDPAYAIVSGISPIWKVGGNHAADIEPGMTFVVEGAVAANDGPYTVVSAVNNGADTDITVASIPAVNGAVGTVQFYVTTFSSTDRVTFNVAPAITDYIESINVR